MDPAKYMQLQLQHISKYLNNKGFFLLAIVVIVSACGSALADPNPHEFEKWKTDFSKTSIELKEVQAGGPLRDGIPAIFSPRFTSLGAVEEDYYGDEPVIGLEIAGEARAYPLSILIWHEIVNDTVGGRPVAITYCPLCNASIVFDRKLGDKVLSFNTTGRLRKSDLLMYDKETESWWQQFTGEAVIGELTGEKLKVIASRLETYDTFKERFPRGKIMIPKDSDFRDYGRNPYPAYDRADAPFAYHGEMPKGILPMERVVVVRREDKAPVIVRMKQLRSDKQMEVDGVHLTWESGQNSALDSPRISSGREVGNVTVYTKTDDDKTHDIAYEVTFAFVAHAFYSDTKIIGVDIDDVEKPIPEEENLLDDSSENSGQDASEAAEQDTDQDADQDAGSDSETDTDEDEKDSSQ